MGYRDILAVLSSVEGDGHVLKCAEMLSRQHDAFVTGMLVRYMPMLPAVTEGWVIDPRWGDLVLEAQEGQEAQRAVLRQQLDIEVDRSAALTMLVEAGAVRELLAVHCRHSDITLVPRPGKSGDGRTPLVEAALFGSGRPVLVVPPEWNGEPLGKTALVAWNAGRESARALADALPLLDSGARVIVATVDAQPSIEGHGDMPGVDISTHLARRGLSVELQNIDAGGRSAAACLQDAARAVGADMVVMGGYGRTRFSEMVFGGVTRDMLHSSSVPLLMSH